MTETQGGWFDSEDPAYLETRPDDRVSYSVLKALLPARGGCEQKALYKQATPVEVTPEMRFGSLVDLLLFEPEREKDRLRICPGVGDKGTWTAKYKLETIVPLEEQGFLCLKEKDIQPARECVEAILQFEGGWIARMFGLGSEQHRQEVRFQQKAWFMEGDQAVSLRTDAMESVYGGASDREVDWVMDLKTTNDPSPRAFAAQIDKLGYDIQAAVYLRAVEKLTPSPVNATRFWWLAVQNSPPWTPAVYEMDATYIRYATEEYLYAVEQWLGCKALSMNHAASYHEPETFGTIEKPNWR